MGKTMKTYNGGYLKNCGRLKKIIKTRKNVLEELIKENEKNREKYSAEKEKKEEEYYKLLEEKENKRAETKKDGKTDKKSPDSEFSTSPESDNDDNDEYPTPKSTPKSNKMSGAGLFGYCWKKTYAKLERELNDIENKIDEEKDIAKELKADRDNEIKRINGLIFSAGTYNGGKTRRRYKKNNKKSKTYRKKH